MKKIRVTVPEDIWRLMKNDIEEFGINNNKLCNYILERFKYNRKMDVEKLLETQGRPLKKIIQFDLNVSNREIYYDVLKANEVDIEAEYFRDLFELYTSKFKYQREIFIFEDRVKMILEGIKERKKIKIKYLKRVFNVEPYFIKREERGDENFLFCYDEEKKNYGQFSHSDSGSQYTRPPCRPVFKCHKNYGTDLRGFESGGYSPLCAKSDNHLSGTADHYRSCGIFHYFRKKSSHTSHRANCPDHLFFHAWSRSFRIRSWISDHSKTSGIHRQFIFPLPAGYLV